MAIDSMAILLTYPDYPVNTDTYYGYTTLVGHAGVLLIKATGLTKYYEFGRYQGVMTGKVRNLPVANASFGTDGRPTIGSLKTILSKLAEGVNTQVPPLWIRGALFLKVDYDKMLEQALAAQLPYSVTDFNCGHYAEKVVLKGSPNIDVPTIINPTPNNIVDEYIEEGNAEVTYTPATGVVTLGVSDEADAKR